MNKQQTHRDIDETQGAKTSLATILVFLKILTERLAKTAGHGDEIRDSWQSAQIVGEERTEICKGDPRQDALSKAQSGSRRSKRYEV